MGIEPDSVLLASLAVVVDVPAPGVFVSQTFRGIESGVFALAESRFCLYPQWCNIGGTEDEVPDA